MGLQAQKCFVSEKRHSNNRDSVGIFWEGLIKEAGEGKLGLGQTQTAWSSGGGPEGASVSSGTVLMGRKSDICCWRMWVVMHYTG